MGLGAMSIVKIWKSLPPLSGGVWVAMVTEVLDNKEIPNLVKTDLSSGALGIVTGTQRLGKPLRVQVPEERYDEAVVKLIAERCTELESGGRMIDAILTNTVLPAVSGELLTRMLEGKPVERVHIAVKDGEFDYSFDGVT